MRKNVIHGRKPFIMPEQETDENDLHKLRGNNCGYNEGISYLFSKRVNWCQGDGFLSLGTQTGIIKLANSEWLVLRIGGIDFLHCWLADSIWLECAELLITKR